MFHLGSPAVVLQLCLFFSEQALSWYTFHYKMSLTWQVSVSWLYALNINVNVCTLAAVTSGFHNCYDKLKGTESCCFAEAQTPQHGPCGDRVLWVLSVGEAGKEIKENILLEMVGHKIPLHSPAENRDCCMLTEKPDRTIEE